MAHYGEKVYKCTICNDTFNSKKSMEAHIKSHSESAPPQAPTPPTSSTSESSCSSTSDKENSKDSPSPMVLDQTPSGYDSDIRYILYTSRDRLSPNYINYTVPSTGVDLLAAAATVTEREDIYKNTQDVVFNLMKSNPDAVAALRHPAYFTPPTLQFTPLTAGDGLRRQVEAVLKVEGNNSEEDQVITPPSSNPVSPAPSISPPVSPVPYPDPELSLPIRKRSRMILKSMEASIDLSPVRYSSVIHYAKAS